MARRTTQETEAEPQETVTAAPAEVLEQTGETASQDAPPVVKETVKETEEEKKARTPLAPLDFSAIHINANVDETKAAKFRHTKTGKERDNDQQAADDLVGKAHRRWVDAGSPKDWTEAIQKAGMHLRVRDDQFEPLKARIQRAGTFLGVGIRFGKALASEVDGHIETVFYAKDKPVKEADDVEGES